MADLVTPPEVLYWLDVETTGLLPERDLLLEVAIVPTAMTPGFEQLGKPFTAQIYHGPDLRIADVSVAVIEMHSASGLWRELRGAGSEGRAWGQLRAAIREWGLKGAAGYLAGRSVHFDRAWMRAKAPDDVLNDLNLSHRHFDLTAIKAFATLAGVQFSVPEDAHRALDDVLADIELARELVRAVR